MNTEDKIKVLVVEPQKKPYEKLIDAGLKSLQHEVGGYIEASYPFEAPICLLCNEEGKLIGLELNRALRDDDGHIYDVVAGTFLLVGLGEENFTSVPDKYMKQFKEQFQTPEVFTRMNGRLVVLPMEEKKSSIQQKLQERKEQTTPKPKKSPKKEEPTI